MKQFILIFVLSLIAFKNIQSAPVTNLNRIKRQFPGFSPFGQQQGGGNYFPQNQGQNPFVGNQGGFNPFVFPGQFNPQPQNQGQINPQQQNQGQFNPQQQNQGQFNPQQQNQGQTNPQQQNQGQQRPNQFTQQQTTTRATTVSPQVQACTEQCVSSIPATYNPVCGSDGTTYQNRQLFDCNVECGRRITLTQVGGCPGRNATTNRPA